MTLLIYLLYFFFLLVIGPFLGKNFGTTISNWVVTLDALEPFLVDGPSQNPTPLEYLQESSKTAYDINLEVSIKGMA
jgi:fumarylacetoacetase